MSNSGLVTYTKLSPHCRKRTGKISKITIHHAAGVGTAAEIGASFMGSRLASANYGIGKDGSIGLYVPEEKRAFTSSSTANDNVAVTIEVSNSEARYPWPVSEASYRALISLCVDICRRNGIKRLNYTGDATGSLTRHNMFAATLCPGPYLQARFPTIAAEVNTILEEDEMTGEEIYRRLTEYLSGQPTSEYAAEASRRGIKSGLFKDGDNDGLVDNPKGLLTRQDFALVLDRMGAFAKTEAEEDDGK